MSKYFIERVLTVVFLFFCFSVNAFGDVSYFDVVASPTEINLEDQNTFSLTVTAKDSSGNTVEDYTGTIGFSANVDNIILPSEYTFTLFDKGTHTFTVEVNEQTDDLRITVFEVDPSKMTPVSTTTYLRSWLLNGTFSEPVRGSQLDTDHIGEETVMPSDGDVSGGQVWFVFNSTGDLINLEDSHAFGPVSRVCSYAHLYIYTKTERVLDLSLGSDDAVKVWLNGEVVHENNVYRAHSFDADRVSGVIFKAGWNRILVKVAEWYGRYSFSMRILENGENTQADNLYYTLNKPVSGTSNSVKVTADWGEFSDYELTVNSNDVEVGDTILLTVRAVDENGKTVKNYTGIVKFSANIDNIDLPDDYTFTLSDKGQKTFSIIPRESTPCLKIKVSNIDSSTVKDVSTTTYLRSWLLNGTFSEPVRGSQLNTDHIGETTVTPSNGDVSGGRKWFYYNSSSDLIDFENPNAFGRVDRVCAYAHLYIFSDNNRTVDLSVGSDDAIKIWVNGTVVHENNVYRAHSFDADRVSGVNLNSGWNRILVKVAEWTGRYSFSMRIFNEGTNVQTDGLKYSLDKVVEKETSCIIVNSGPLAKLGVSAPSKAIANKPFSITVSGQDEYGNTRFDYKPESGKVILSVTGSGSLSPLEIPASSFVNGSATISVTYDKVENIRIKANDGKYSGESGNIDVGWGEIDSFKVEVEENHYINRPFDVTVTAIDEYGNTVQDYTGTISFSYESAQISDSDIELPTDYTFTGSDKGTHTFSNGVTVKKGVDDLVIIVRDSSSSEEVSTTHYLRKWLLLGTWPALNNSTQLDVIPNGMDEENVEPSEGDTIDGNTWTRYSSSTDYIDLNSYYGGPDRVISYAHLYVYSSKDQSVDLSFGNDDKLKVWLNGNNILTDNRNRAHSYDRWRVNCTLNKGWNRLLVKLSDWYGQYRFSARILEPGTNNYVSGLLQNTDKPIEGRSDTLTIGEDKDPPQEVSSFTATPGDKKVYLKWTNPMDEDFEGTMIRYRLDNYPIDENDGLLVGDFKALPGTNGSFTHQNLINGLTYYYTAFAYDIEGNYSSGRNAKAYLPLKTIRFELECGSNQTAGKDFSLTIKAISEKNDVNKDYHGSAKLKVIYIKPYSGTKTLSQTTVSNFSNGIAKVNISYPDAGIIRIQAIDTADSDITGVSSEITFYPASFSVNPIISNGNNIQSVLEPFDLEVLALNQNGDVTPNFSLPVSLYIKYVSPLSDQGGKLSQTKISSFIKGKAYLKNVTYDRWGKIAIKARLDSNESITGESKEIMFIPKNFSIDLTEPPADRDFYYIDEQINVKITALGYTGSPVFNYGGEVIIKYNGSFNGPQNHTFISADKGVYEFKMSGNEEGAYKIEVKDINYESTKSESNTISIKYGEIAVLSLNTTVGEVEVTIVVRDREGQIIQSDNSTKFILSKEESTPNNSCTSDSFEKEICVKNGIAKIILKDNEPETVTLTPKSDPYLAPVPGEIIFGTIGSNGVRIIYWKERK